MEIKDQKPSLKFAAVDHGVAKVKVYVQPPEIVVLRSVSIGQFAYCRAIINKDPRNRLPRGMSRKLDIIH